MLRSALFLTALGLLAACGVNGQPANYDEGVHEPEGPTISVSG